MLKLDVFVFVFPSTGKVLSSGVEFSGVKVSGVESSGKNIFLLARSLFFATSSNSVLALLRSLKATALSKPLVACSRILFAT